MKANELMIGDWVLINGVPKKIQAVDGVDDEIMADDELYTLAEDRYHSEDKVEGVPITPEIMEKNGFYLNGIEDYNKPTFNIDYGKWAYANEDEFDVVGDGADIKYVHQLQHALRLCGIEKEITI